MRKLTKFMAVLLAYVLAVLGTVAVWGFAVEFLSFLVYNLVQGGGPFESLFYAAGWAILIVFSGAVSLVLSGAIIEKL